MALAPGRERTRRSPSMAIDRPEAPFHDWPVDLFIEGVGYAWYRRDVGAFVTQATLALATPAAADLVNDYMDHVILHEQRSFARLGGLTVLYDWRSIKGVDPASATRFMQRLAQRERGYLRRSAVVFSPSSSFMLETALHAASAFAALTLGKRVQILTDILVPFAEFGLRSPPRPTDLRSLKPVMRGTSVPPLAG
jgi:hypothetical protein